MHNKRIKSGVAALALGAVLIGGTFAWFTASDNLTNMFRTTDASTSSKVDIYEVVGDKDDDGNIKIDTNGNRVDKKVQVKNESNYDSIIKVDFTKEFVIEDGVNIEKLNPDNIILEVLNGSVITQDEIILNTDDTISNLEYVKGKWVKILKAEQKTDGDGNEINPVEDYDYYYIGNVAPNGYTTQLLDNVRFTSTDPNHKNLGFKVIVNAQSVQSTVDALTTSSDIKEDQNFGGFDLKSEEHKRLIVALTAVINGPSEIGEEMEGASNMEDDQATE